MRKSIVITSTVMIALLLAACGNQSSSTKNTSSSVKTTKKVSSRSSSKPQADKFNNNEYGVMGYLIQSQTSASKLANTTRSTGDNEGMRITKNGNTYTFEVFPMGHSTNVIVNNDNVTVKYDENTDGSGMGDKNGSKTYSKDELANKFANQKMRLIK